jgi:uncharacterized membrane protein YdjX (TVP38/TMEM64 family)
VVSFSTSLVQFFRMSLPSKALDPSVAPKGRQFRRFLPLLAIGAAVAIAWLLGLDRHISLSAIADNRENLREFVADNRALALASYALIYVAATVLILPGAALLTMLGGFLFGWPLAAPVTVISASLGATILFLSARSSFGDLLLKKGGSIAAKLARNFEKNAFSYLLFLRLVPLFPFFVVNIAPALCNIKTRIFVLATVIGIIPATFAYALLGAGLGSRLDQYQNCVRSGDADSCALAFNPLSLLTTEVIISLALLGVMALIPPLLNRFKASKTAG